MFPMGMVSPRMTQGRWKSRLFLTSTIRIVPADVGCIWVDGCAAGGGGGGGYDGEGGGGGAGGMCGDAISKVIMPVIPLETLTLIIGAAGLGGAKGNAGTDGGYTQISGSQRTLTLRPSYAGGSGTVSAGGVGVGFPNTGSSTVNLQFLPGGYGYPFQEIPAAISASGGGPSSNGGSNYSVVNGLGLPNYTGGGTGNATGGGGGCGGHHFFSGLMARGGDGGSPGANATGYGGGGGGGGGNAAGGNGSPGFIRIYCFTAYEI